MHEKERKAIREAYPGIVWKWKVDNMRDEQVIAVYLNLKSKGRVA